MAIQGTSFPPDNGFIKQEGRENLEKDNLQKLKSEEFRIDTSHCNSTFQIKLYSNDKLFAKSMNFRGCTSAPHYPLPLCLEIVKELNNVLYVDSIINLSLDYNEKRLHSILSAAGFI